MTLYAYRCEDCGLEQDFIFKMGEAPAEFKKVYRGIPPANDERHHFRRVYTASALQPNGSMGDGVFTHYDPKTNIEYRGSSKMAGRKAKNKTRWV
jgi:predicted nucleic acid-binding Zn ribbon protein